MSLGIARELKFITLKKAFMTKIFTLFFTSLFSLTLLAYDGSKLSFSTAGKSSTFKIEIDGRKVNMRDNSITLTNISEGSHNVRIYKERAKTGLGLGKRQDLIYAGAVFICDGVHTDITVNRFGKVFIDERRIDMGDEWDSEEDINDNIGIWNDTYSNVMTSHEFDIMKEQLRREWSETNRLGSAKTIIDKTSFTTAQVMEMMMLFSFESNKLEVAKYAYRKTVDKKNYFQVEDELNYKNSREELARFIANN